MVLAGALITAGGLAWLLAAEHRKSSSRFIAKPLASFGFLLTALGAGALDSTFGRWMLAGLVLSALGDAFLLGKQEAAFLAGLGSFLLAHVVFGVAFLARGVSALGLLAVLPLAVFAWRVLRWLSPHISGRMRAPVTAYAVAISLMGVLAIATAVELWDWRIPVGAVLFIASDIAVARDNFVSAGFVNRMWGLPLYFSGQLLLAWAAGG
ncbi:MAG: lysoplasmalogenase [Acidimicrobiia bacterium]|nr:lysoplasmalogenase [Acidimicrobiia bacterium]